MYFLIFFLHFLLSINLKVYPHIHCPQHCLNNQQHRFTLSTICGHSRHHCSMVADHWSMEVKWWIHVVEAVYIYWVDWSNNNTINDNNYIEAVFITLSGASSHFPRLPLLDYSWLETLKSKEERLKSGKHESMSN